MIPGRTGRAFGWFAFAALLRSEPVTAPRLERPLVAEF
jgi:hypothetical protein